MVWKGSDIPTSEQGLKVLEPFGLKAILAQASTRHSRFGCLFLLLPSRHVTGRRKWKQDDISHQAWLRVLMGRRPPLVRWPFVHGRSENFVERAQKRLASHDEVRGKLVLELQEGQTRLSKFRAEVAKVLPAQVCSPPYLAVDVDTLTAERSAAVRMPSMTPAGSGPPAVDALPDAIRSSGSREVVVGSARGFAGRFGVCRLWLYRQADSIVVARSREVARNVRGWRRSQVVAFSTRRRSFFALLKDTWFHMVLLYGLRGVRVGEASNPGPSSQLSSGHGSPSESLPPTRRSARLQAMGPRAGHRRGLVVEVALGVVDAAAVALPSAPNVVTCVVEFNEPVFSDRSSRANPGGQR